VRFSGGGLQRRIVVTLLAYGLMVCALFGGVSFLFAYVVEDAFFARMLEEEVAHQQAALRTTGRPAPPLRDFVAIHLSPATLPDAVRAGLEAEPMAEEIAGPGGLHYHVRRFVPPDSSRTAHVVGEMSRYLVVRPLAGEILAMLGLLSITLVGVAAGLAVWLGRRAAAPLARLAAQVAAGGTDALPRGLADGVPADDEVGVLARALDDAMTRIAALIDREKAFTRDASHELRTPLALIRANADLLADRPDLPAAAAAPLRRIRQAGLDMEHTVDLLLTLAREADYRVPAAPVRLRRLVEQAVIDLPAPMQDRTMDLEIAVPDMCEVAVPVPVMALVLANLLGNALRHGRTGTVRISWEAPWLVVADNGPGLPDGVASRLFEPGAKGPESAGQGLGLSIVKRLCDRHGLDLDITNGPAGGVRARVRLA